MDRLATEVVVEVGTEGASYGLYRERTANGFAYFVTLSDMPYPDDDGATGVVRNSPRVASFEEALLLFDQEPFWPILSAVRVPPSTQPACSRPSKPGYPAWNQEGAARTHSGSGARPAGGPSDSGGACKTGALAAVRRCCA